MNRGHELRANGDDMRLNEGGLDEEMKMERCEDEGACFRWPGCHVFVDCECSSSPEYFNTLQT